MSVSFPWLLEGRKDRVLFCLEKIGRHLDRKTIQATFKRVEFSVTQYENTGGGHVLKASWSISENGFIWRRYRLASSAAIPHCRSRNHVDHMGHCRSGDTLTPIRTGNRAGLCATSSPKGQQAILEFTRALRADVGNLRPGKIFPDYPAPALFLSESRANALSLALWGRWSRASPRSTNLRDIFAEHRGETCCSLKRLCGMHKLPIPISLAISFCRRLSACWVMAAASPDEPL
ncbi:MAG TPA: hypothetical protein VGN98_12380, partial [Tianweitania sediminis]|nr:hypothetical protein [Tianweitania sediminis]